MPAERIFLFSVLTGLDRIVWAVSPDLELRRVVRKLTKQYGQSTDESRIRFEMPDGKRYSINDDNSLRRE